MKTSVQQFFEDYAAALITFSAEEIASFYQAPVAIYSDQGLQTVQEMTEIVAFWEQGVKPYAAQNIEKAMPRILSEEQLSEKNFVSKVLWNNFNNVGNQVAEETNFYILTQHDEGLKISGLILMTKVD